MLMFSLMSSAITRARADELAVPPFNTDSSGVPRSRRSVDDYVDDYGVCARFMKAYDDLQDDLETTRGCLNDKVHKLKDLNSQVSKLEYDLHRYKSQVGNEFEDMCQWSTQEFQAIKNEFVCHAWNQNTFTPGEEEEGWYFQPVRDHVGCNGKDGEFMTTPCYKKEDCVEDAQRYCTDWGFSCKGFAILERGKERSFVLYDSDAFDTSTCSGQHGLQPSNPPAFAATENLVITTYVKTFGTPQVTIPVSRPEIGWAIDDLLERAGCKDENILLEALMKLAGLTDEERAEFKHLLPYK